MPCSAAYWTQSSIGKNASDAITAASVILSPACLMAIFVESMRFGCPAPIPSVCLSSATTIAFDFVCLTAFQANINASSCSFVGLFLVTTFHSDSFSSMTSCSCIKSPPIIETVSKRVFSSLFSKSSCSRRIFFFLAKTSNASSS